MAASFRRRSFRFSLKSLMALVAMISLTLGGWHWLTRKVIEIKAVAPDERVSKRAFFFCDGPVKARNIAVATGAFTKTTWLEVSLFLVQGELSMNVSLPPLGERQCLVAQPGKT